MLGPTEARMWWIATAQAALPWDCPTLTTPAEASPYRGSDAGASEALDQLEALAMAYWDDGCAWEYREEKDGYTEATTATCATEAYSVVSSRETYADFYGRTESTTLDVSVPSGEAWTRLVLTTRRWEWEGSGTTYGSETTRGGTWVGAPAGFPADGTLTLSTSSAQGDLPTDSVFVESPTCALRWAHSGAGTYQESESVGFTPGIGVRVSRLFDVTVCDAFDSVATIDDVLWGGVVAEDWSDDPADPDRDGYTSTCDCDDADPTRNAYAVDTPDDGIDQDCDGSDGEPVETGETGDTGEAVDTDSEEDAGEAPPNDETCGCGSDGSAGWALLGAVALLRRGSVRARTFLVTN